MRVYEAIVKTLESVDVDAAFGGPGENAAGLMVALKHSRNIRPVIVRHEQAASCITRGYAIDSTSLVSSAFDFSRAYRTSHVLAMSSRKSAEYGLISE